MQWTLILTSLLFLVVSSAFPIPANDKTSTGVSSKGGAFNPSFDEIVVESSLTVRGKSSQRQGRKLVVAPSSDPVTIKIASGVSPSTVATPVSAAITSSTTSTSSSSPSSSSSSPSSSSPSSSSSTSSEKPS